MKTFKSHFGFTLAEVLITLGIIGVVAAITLPSVINKAQKFILKQQFKKSISIVSNAVRKAYADLEFVPNCAYNAYGGGEVFNNDCKLLNNTLINNLKTVKYCPNKALEKGCIANIKGADTVSMANDPDLSEEDAKKMHKGYSNFHESKIHNNIPAWVLADGQVIMLYGITTPLYLIDINGLKGPNKWGYDIYTFILRDFKLICVYDFIEPGGTSCSTLLKNN